jgi:hypothetical protein
MVGQAGEPVAVTRVRDKHGDERVVPDDGVEECHRVPGPQQEALRTVFAMSAGPVPDQFLVGQAALGLLSDAAVEGPLVCVVPARTAKR